MHVEIYIASLSDLIRLIFVYIGPHIKVDKGCIIGRTSKAHQNASNLSPYPISMTNKTMAYQPSLKDKDMFFGHHDPSIN